MLEINEYNDALPDEFKIIADKLMEVINRVLIDSRAKLYHGSPVWFIDDNPVVGYSLKKTGLALLFWSGQSFSKAGLTAVGKHKAAEIVYTNATNIDDTALLDFLEESKSIIWDYKNIVKNKGKLELVKRRN